MYSSFRTNASPAETSRQPKPKRAQVSRACEACRIARSKCDAVRPCRSCKKSGRDCVSGGAQVTSARGSTSAQSQEVDRLRARVQELEAQASQAQQSSQSLTTPPVAVSSEPISQTQSWNWKGITKEGLHYGPLSDQFFIERISSELSHGVSPPPPPVCLLNGTALDLGICDKLGKSQQDYFFDLFWLAYHVNFPALDETDFRNLYASVWRPDGTRVADPLIDIFLALNMQYAFSYLGDDGVAGECAAVAGKAFYHRCQVALGQAIETPSMKVVQCHFFSAVYLAFARCYNTAHITVKTAGNILSTLSTDELDQDNQELHARVIRCISMLDTRLSFKLGRFTSMHIPRTPTPTREEFDWKIYHIQLLSLCDTSRSIYTTFMNKIDPLLTSPDTFYTSHSVRDDCAIILTTQMKALEDWVSHVPSSLQNPRVSGAQPFSTYRSVLDFQDAEPQWIQRQRLALECQYHAFCISLERLFIHFSPTPLRGTYNADSNCVRCVNHAIMLTSILAQGFKETDILTGCYQAFEWQQDATFALASFAIAYPVCSPTPSARKALAEAGETFGCFGRGNQAAVIMRALTKEFDDKIGERFAKFKGSMGMNLTPPDSVEESNGQASENIDPRLRGSEQVSFIEPMPDTMPSFWSARIDEGQLWPMEPTSASHDLWGSFIGGSESNQANMGI